MPIPNYFLPKQHFTRSFSNDLFIQANCNHDYYLYSFFPRTMLDWNSLLSGIRTSTNFSLFKDHCFSAIRNIIVRCYLSIFFIFIYLIYLYSIVYNIFIFYIYWSRNNFIIWNYNNFILLYVIYKCVFFLFFVFFKILLLYFWYCNLFNLYWLDVKAFSINKCRCRCKGNRVRTHLESPWNLK